MAGRRRMAALVWIVAAYAALVGYGQVNEVAAMLAVIGGSYGASVALHELGHAVVATLTRQRVHQISVGWGPLLGSAQLGLTKVELRAFPTEGFVLSSTSRRRGLRVRKIALCLAGPAANVGVVGAVVVLAPGGSFWPTVALTNAWLALCSLLPIDDEDRGIRTDGWQALRTLFAKGSTLDTDVEHHRWYEASALDRAGRTAQALDAVTSAGDPYADDGDFDAFAAATAASLARPALDDGRPELAERLARLAIRRVRSGSEGVELRTVLATAILDRLDATPSRPDDPRLLLALEHAQTAVAAGGGEPARIVLARADLLRQG